MSHVRCQRRSFPVTIQVQFENVYTCATRIMGNIALTYYKLAFVLWTKLFENNVVPREILESCEKAVCVRMRNVQLCFAKYPYELKMINQCHWRFLQVFLMVKKKIQTSSTWQLFQIRVLNLVLCPVSGGQWDFWEICLAVLFCEVWSVKMTSNIKPCKRIINDIILLRCSAWRSGKVCQLTLSNSMWLHPNSLCISALPQSADLSDLYTFHQEIRGLRLDWTSDALF